MKNKRETLLDMYKSYEADAAILKARYKNILQAFRETQGFHAIPIGTEDYFALPPDRQYACDVFWNHQVTVEIEMSLRDAKDWADFYFDLYSARIAH